MLVKGGRVRWTRPTSQHDVLADKVGRRYAPRPKIVTEGLRPAIAATSVRKQHALKTRVFARASVHSTS